jgi:hypothetical protein
MSSSISITCHYPFTKERAIILQTLGAPKPPASLTDTCLLLAKILILLHRSKKTLDFASLKQKTTIRLEIEKERPVLWQLCFVAAKKSSAFSSLQQKTIRLEIEKKRPFGSVSCRRLAGDVVGDLTGYLLEKSSETSPKTRRRCRRRPRSKILF